MALELKADERPCLLSFLGLPLASLPAASASTELCSQFPDNSLYPTSPCPGTLITAVLLKGAKRARKATLVSPVYLALAWFLVCSPGKGGPHSLHSAVRWQKAFRYNKGSGGTMWRQQSLSPKIP